MIYAGTFHRTMDAKNRVTIPSEWLSEDEKVLYILPARNKRYLNVMPEAEFARQEEELRAKVPAGGWRTVMRDVFGSARKIEPDKQGRILVPDEFCKALEISTNVSFVGVKNSYELWDAAKLSNAVATKVTELPEEALKALEDMGL
jgi:MraZ protein